MIVVALIAGLTSVGLALGASRDTVIHGCVNNTTHVLRIASKCTSKEHAISWNQTGPPGPAGGGGLRGTSSMSGGWIKVDAIPGQQRAHIAALDNRNRTYVDSGQVDGEPGGAGGSGGAEVSS